jgi:hypothetical protein
MGLKIPRRFKLAGRTWTVKRRKYKKRWLGQTDGARCTIKLNLAHNHSAAELEHTFCHELMHAIGFTIGSNKLINDEQFVDAVGGLLAQALEDL